MFDKHAKLDYKKKPSPGKFTLQKINPDARILVNGEPITDVEELHHNDRYSLGFAEEGPRTVVYTHDTDLDKPFEHQQLDSQTL